MQPDVDVLWDLAPHDLSILDFVLPDGVTPVAVAAHTADPIGTGRACLAYLSLWLSNGVLAHVNVNWLSPIKIRTTIIGGSRRTIVWDDMNPPARLMVHDRGVERLPADTVGPDERRQTLISYRIGDSSIPALPEKEPLLSVHGRIRQLDQRRPGAAHRRGLRPARPRRPRGRVAQRGAGRGPGPGRQSGSHGGKQMIKGQRCLVTGGAGTIGSTIVDQLVAADAAEVIVLDNLVRGRRENLAGALESGQGHA